MVQKTPNRDVSPKFRLRTPGILTKEQENGYVQIAPIVAFRTRVMKGAMPRRKPAPQNAHRLVVLASKR